MSDTHFDTRQMSDDEMRRMAQGLALLAAKEEYEERHPDCSEQAAFEWARRHWRKKRFVYRVITFLTMSTIKAETQEVAQQRLN